MYNREMLTYTLKAIVFNPFKKSFYGKIKIKKKNNVLTVFSITRKNGVKIFLKWIVNQYFKNTH